jgi:hypothetical protein
LAEGSTGEVYDPAAGTIVGSVALWTETQTPGTIGAQIGLNVVAATRASAGTTGAAVPAVVVVAAAGGIELKSRSARRTIIPNDTAAPMGRCVDTTPER